MITRERIFKIISIGNKEDRPSTIFDYFITITIFVNIACMILETFDEVALFIGVIKICEFVTVIIFCIEYVFRIITADYLYPKDKRPMAILKFLVSFDGVVDLLTILPFSYLSGFVVFRLLRVVRIFHLFRVNTQFDSFNVIAAVFKEKKNQIVSSVFILLILMTASSLGMYSLEHNAQPEVFKNAFSGMWWSISAMLTVGYGDICPITVPGKILAIITALLGVGVVAIPTGIISAGFVEQYQKAKNFKSLSIENSLNFVCLHIHSSHELKGQKLMAVNLPDGLLPALILREEQVILPKGDIIIQENDNILLASEYYFDADRELKLVEKTLSADDEWVGKEIKDLDISRRTTIVTIHRKNKLLLPDGRTALKAGDKIIMYTA